MILFLDTVSPLPKFSLINNNKVIHSIQIINEKSSKISDCIIPAFQELRKKIPLNKKIDRLAVCTGPGSYTALRVGIAFMYGFSFSKKIPLTGISYSNLLRFTIHKNNINKTLLFICSSNNQNFVCTFSNRKEQYIIKKLNDKFQSNEIDYSKFDYSISNYKFPLKHLHYIVVPVDRYKLHLML